MERAMLGWQHRPGPHFGHYLDCDEFLCGEDPQGFTGGGDLRATPPEGACRKCLRAVERAGGKVEHRHRWIRPGGYGSGADQREVCESCGEQRTKDRDAR